MNRNCGMDEAGSLTRRIAAILAMGAASVVLVAGLSGCGQKRGQSASDGALSTVAPAEVGPRAPANRRSSVTEEVADVTATSAPPNLQLATAEAAMPRREIIYVGEMTIEVDDVEAASGRLDQALQASAGWVSSRQLNTDSEGHRTAVVEIRVPAASFNGIHEAVKKFGEVVHDVVQSRDVGREFVDLEARLRNLEREETVIVGLFDRRGKISEVLEVERELARVRGEIEQIQGQLRYLRDQVGYSTLRITLAPKRPAIERKMESWNLGYHVLRAWRLLVSVVRAFTHLFIYTLVVVLPLAAIAWAIWRGVRYLNRKGSRSE